MQSTALSHYHAFIDSASCMSVVQQQLSRACEGLEELSKVVPDLATSFEGFSKDAAAVMAQRSSNKQLLGEDATAHPQRSWRIVETAVAPLDNQPSPPWPATCSVWSPPRQQPLVSKQQRTATLLPL